jgi:hypothetical protein
MAALLLEIEVRFPSISSKFFSKAYTKAIDDEKYKKRAGLKD